MNIVTLTLLLQVQCIIECFWLHDLLDGCWQQVFAPWSSVKEIWRGAGTGFLGQLRIYLLNHGNVWAASLLPRSPVKANFGGCEEAAHFIYGYLILQLSLINREGSAKQ